MGFCCVEVNIRGHRGPRGQLSYYNLSYLDITFPALARLRRHVLQVANKCKCWHILDFHSGETEIGYFDVALLRHQNIFRFQIPVNDVFGVEETDGFDDLRDDSPDEILSEGFLFHVVIEVSTFEILHNDVDFFWVLERLDDVDQKVILTSHNHFFQDV